MERPAQVLAQRKRPQTPPQSRTSGFGARPEPGQKRLSENRPKRFGVGSGLDLGSGLTGLRQEVYDKVHGEQDNDFLFCYPCLKTLETETWQILRSTSEHATRAS